MKNIIRHLIINTFSLYLAGNVAEGLIFGKGLPTLFLAGFGLTLASLLVKPVINILLLPLNLITFGLFRFLSSAIALYLVSLVIGDFSIDVFSFPGFTSTWFDLPAIEVGGLLAIVFFSILISLINSVIYWVVK